MQALQITFRNIPPSKTIERLVRQKAQKLEKFYSRIIGCHVTLETPRQRHRKGNSYEVHLDIQVPGRNFAVTSAQHHKDAHELLSIAVRDVFDAARRQLQDYVGAEKPKRSGPPAAADAGRDDAGGTGGPATALPSAQPGRRRYKELPTAQSTLGLHRFRTSNAPGQNWKK